MRAAYDAAAVRAAEAPLLASLPPETLMRRAAFALARRCVTLLGSAYGARVVVLAGSGGNGGDAMYAGAHLARRGARVDVLLLTPSAHEPALVALREAGARIRPAGGTAEVDAGSESSVGSDADAGLLAAADLVLDGMVGIGATGPLRPPMARLATLLSNAAGIVVAVDVPSGVDASTGTVAGAAVRADVTVTFGALKAGLMIDPGAGYSGRVEVVDVGLTLPPSSLSLLDAADVAAAVPTPSAESDKYRRGVLGIAAGSATYTGAAVLSSGGALATGAGMVRFVGPIHPAELVRQRWPETVVTVIEAGDGAAVLDAGRVQAWVVGHGLGTDDAAGRIISAVLSADVPVLVDADAITWLASRHELLAQRSAPTLLTPHAGELARLMDVERSDVEGNRLAHVTRAALALGVTVLLKGSTTLVATPAGEVRINTAATPYLGTAGSGDVLSGICGALLAGGRSPLDAGSAGAFVHGLAGLLAAGTPAAPITAVDVAAAVPDAIRAVRR